MVSIDSARASGQAICAVCACCGGSLQRRICLLFFILRSLHNSRAISRDRTDPFRHSAAIAALTALLASPAGLHSAFAQDATEFPDEAGVIQLPQIDVGESGITATTAGPVEGYRALTAVTGTRTETPLNRIPQSIQVVPRSLIEDQQDQTLQDALENVSGVTSPEPQETLLSAFTVRGFDADQFIDGTPVFGATNVFDTGTLINVERIEVLKGPSATLFGGGTGAPLGGVINVVPRIPEFEASYTAGGRGGSLGTVNPFWDINLPVSDGKVAFRFSGDFERADSHIDFVESERVLLSPSLRAALTEDTELLIRAIHAENAYLEYSGIPAEGAVAGAFPVDRFRYSGATGTPDTRVRNTFLQARLTHDFSDATKGTVRASYYDSYFEENSTFLFGSAVGPSAPSVFPVFSGILETDVEQFNAQASLSHAFEIGSASNTTLVGFEFDRTENPAELNFGFIGFLDYADPNSDLDYLPPDGTLLFTQDNIYTTHALYAQQQVTFWERLHLLGGLRWTRLTIDERALDRETAEYRFTPRAGAAFDATESLTPFVSYGRGFEGVAAFTGETSAKPEESEQIEAGVRFSFDAIGLSGSAVVYELTRQNVPVADPNRPGIQIQTGEQRARGAEFDLIWKATSALTILGNYVYTDAEVTEDTTVPEGDRLARVPLHSGRIAARYEFSSGRLDGLGLGLGLTAASEREITLPNDLETDAFFSIDAQASYEIGLAVLRLSIENLTDEEYFEPYQFLGQSVVRPARLRTVFLSLSATY